MSAEHPVAHLPLQQRSRQSIEDFIDFFAVDMVSCSDCTSLKLESHLLDIELLAGIAKGACLSSSGSSDPFFPSMPPPQ